MKIVVTGASGFIGSRFIEVAKNQFDAVSISLKNKNIASIDLAGVNAIVHLAGKAHEMGNVDEQDYYKVNYLLTKQLCEKAIKDKVPHFIYASTVKVYGEETDIVLNENSPCYPTDPYGKSKLQAEDFLKSKTAEIKIAIIRPPMVYGAGVKGNMLRLLHLCNKNIPLPFGKTGNKRSMVFIDNLVELIIQIIQKKATGIFIPADAKPLSTDGLLNLIKTNLGKKAPLISVPVIIRKLIKATRPALYYRLFGSFVIDNSNTNKLLNFKPPYSSAQGISSMVEWFKTLPDK